MAKKLPIKNSTAIILLLIGFALVAVGYNLISTISGKGLEGTGTLILVIVLMLSGAVIFLITLSLWVFGTLYKKYGSLMTIAIIVVGIFIAKYLFTKSFEVDIKPSVMAESLGGSVRRESLAYWEAIDEIAPGEPVELLAVTSKYRYGHPYFKIKYGNGKSGYLSGEHICANTVWVNGLSTLCSSNSQQKSVEPYNSKSNGKPIELIKSVQEYLPGFWEAVDNDKEEPKILVFSREAASMGLFDELGYSAKRMYPDYRLHLDELNKTMMFINIDRHFEDMYPSKEVNQHVYFHIRSIDALNLEISKPQSGQHKTSEKFSDEHKVIRYKRIDVFEEPYVKNINPPIKAESLGGTVLTESIRQDKIAELTPGEPIELLSVTKILSRGYPYFKIRFAEGQTGYLTGENICANTKWVKGLSSPCSSYKPHKATGPVYSKSKEHSIDLIYRTYKYLPGVWEAVEDKGYENRDYKNEPRLIFGKDATDPSVSQLPNARKYPYFRLDFDDSSKLIKLFVFEKIVMGKNLRGDGNSFEINRIDSKKLEIYKYGSRYRYKRVKTH